MGRTGPSGGMGRALEQCRCPPCPGAQLALLQVGPTCLLLFQAVSDPLTSASLLAQPGEAERQSTMLR